MKIKKGIEKCLKKIEKEIKGRKIEIFFYYIYCIFGPVQYFFLNLSWRAKGGQLPSKKERELVKEKVTFIYKSFERQGMAKRLFYNIQKYYPGALVIIADDSRKKLKINSPYAKVIHLPFNSGLSYGLNRALELVKTPYVVRLDDDMLLTPFSRIGNQLEFLLTHEEVDLVGILPLTAPLCKPVFEVAKIYFAQTMSYAPKKLKIPHMTVIGKNHIVVGKSPNIFIVRAEKMKQIGYDDNIRMIDHDEFFRRAAGEIVSAIDVSSFIFHYPNVFDKNYRKFRSDYWGDVEYIRQKYQ